MGKIHVLMKKEDIDQEKIGNGKIAVVLDVLLATSTITSALEFGAEQVIPVLDQYDALAEAKALPDGSYLLSGEYEGKTIEGFLDPNPLQLKKAVKGKTLILSTTNGTVAIKRTSGAKRVYVASLLNGRAIAKKLNQEHPNETIVVVCSGSSGEFALEDFYGAGYLINQMISSLPDWELTDAARAASSFYRGSEQSAEDVLISSRVGEMIKRYGYEDEVRFVASEGIFSIIPFVDGKKTIIREEVHHDTNQV
ncbi:2-phosphosulfolactate phosphatase [Bacillus sp. NTK071]|uniref:2-phosphosulfolactate phosphatase n=1 Tax=Bacillus sp. NTK071 TaxID=2802175 RepID=UPI001A8E125E|nr:2-phosphosulfolactate phosphatase [Bacillus sp. NTK071]MBN8207847.1 2-phosphosulfolactate phosphatase [Bacillus sp. NTK071]